MGWFTSLRSHQSSRGHYDLYWALATNEINLQAMRRTTNGMEILARVLNYVNGNPETRGGTFPNENQRYTKYYRYTGIKVSRSSV